MIKKKAQSGLQFNWIFILIAGAIILTMFIMIINKQQETKTQEESYKLSKKINTLLTAIKNNEGTIQEFNIPEAEINFVCNDLESHYYIQGIGPITTETIPLFTNKQLTGRTIVTWAQKINHPLDYQTALYLTNKKTLYAYITTTQENTAEQLYEEMPKEFKKTLIRLDQITKENIEQEIPKGYEQYVIITTHENLEPWKKTRIITIPRTITNEGTIKINNQETTYFTKELLWGAIISEDKEFYECNKKKIYDKIITVSEILKKRNEKITEETGLTVCTGLLAEAKRQYQKIIDEATEQDDEGLYQELTRLKELIEYSKRGYKCPPIN